MNLCQEVGYSSDEDFLKLYREAPERAHTAAKLEQEMAMTSRSVALVVAILFSSAQPGWNVTVTHPTLIPCP